MTNKKAPLSCAAGAEHDTNARERGQGVGVPGWALPNTGAAPATVPPSSLDELDMPRACPTQTPAIHAVLRRLGQSAQREVFVVRGGIVTAHFVAPSPRPSADLDLLAELPFEPEDFTARLAEVLAVELDDGVTLVHERQEIIWEETEFPGLRLFLRWHPVEPPLQVDIGFGDPLVDGPIELELLPDTSLRCCRPETMFAWKVHGLFEHGPGRWRAKDLHDLDLLERYAELDPNRVARALVVAFASRGDSLTLIDRLLADEFGHSRASRRKWRRFVRDAPEGVALDELVPVLDRVRASLRHYLEARAQRR